MSIGASFLVSFGVLSPFSTGLVGGDACSSGGAFSGNFGSDFLEYSGRRDRLSRFHFVVGSCLVELLDLPLSSEKCKNVFLK